MAERSDSKRALMCGFLGLSGLSCLAEAQDTTHGSLPTAPTLSKGTEYPTTLMEPATAKLNQTYHMDVLSTVTRVPTVTTETYTITSVASGKPVNHFPPEYYDEDSKGLSGKLMEMVTERCYAEAIHRQLQLYPNCQDWVREDKVAHELFDSMPATWMAQDLAADNERKALTHTISDGCNNVCHVKQMSALCDRAAITAFGWVDQTCNTYQWDRTVRTTKNQDPDSHQDSYQGNEGPGSFDGQKITWGYYRTIQAVASIVGEQAYHKPFQSVANFHDWLPKINMHDFWDKKEHWNNWKKKSTLHLNDTETTVTHDLAGDDAVNVDVDDEDLNEELLNAHPLVDKRKKKEKKKKKNKHGKHDPSTTCLSRKMKWSGPCGATDPWISSSLAKIGVFEALMMPGVRIDKDDTSGPIARLAHPQGPYEPDSLYRPYWYKRMSAVLRTSILEDVLRRESFLRYVLEAAQNRGSNAMSWKPEPEPVYPARAYWTWDYQNKLRDRKHSPAGRRLFWKSHMWLFIWQSFKAIENKWIDPEIKKPDHRPVEGSVYKYTYFDVQKEKNEVVYLQLSQSREGQERALEKNMLIEWDILDQDSKATGKKILRRAKDVVDLTAAARAAQSSIASKASAAAASSSKTTTQVPSGPSLTVMAGTTYIFNSWAVSGLTLLEPVMVSAIMVPSVSLMPVQAPTVLVPTTVMVPLPTAAPQTTMSTVKKVVKSAA